MLYLITYDLYRPQQDYTRLFSVIQSQGVALRCLQSVWLLQTNTDVDTIQASLQGAIDQTDRILVVDITQKRRNGWMNRNIWEWMTQHDF